MGQCFAQPPVTLYVLAKKRDWNGLASAIDSCNAGSLQFTGYTYVNRNWAKDPKETVLHIAIVNEAPIHVVKKLLDVGLSRGLSINETNFDGDRPLHLATMRNNTDLVKLLLSCGADVKAINASGCPPLLLILDDSINTEVAKVLLQHPPNDVKLLLGLTSLHLAILKKLDVEFTSSLMETQKLDANVRAADEDQLTPLHTAARCNAKLPIVRLLLEKGADVNAKSKSGMTPLHYAAKNGASTHMVKLLLENGGNTDIEDQDGRTALNVAMKENQTHLYALLETVPIAVVLEAAEEG